MNDKKDEFIVFGKPDLSDADIEAVSKVLRTGWIGRGPICMEFEKAFAAYQQVKYAHAVNSCSSALLISLRALGIKAGDEVITTALTFAATVNSIVEVGAKPVLVDIDLKTGLLDLQEVEKRISSATKAILPVHLYGTPVNMDDLLYLRKKYGIRIIHDCAHAIEAQWQGRPLGNFPDVSCFSFYSTKNLTTIEGGMICSDDDLFMERCRLISSQGMTRDAWKRFSAEGYQHYDVTSAGFKFNFTDSQAALGLSQLKDIERKWKIREKTWNRYLEVALSLGNKVEIPSQVSSPQRHAFHLFTLRVPPKTGISRDTILTRLQSLGIGCGVHYLSIPTLSYFRQILKNDPACPNATRFGNETFSIPFTPYLKEREISRILSGLQSVLDTKSMKQAA